MPNTSVMHMPADTEADRRGLWLLGEKALTIARILRSCEPLLYGRDGYPETPVMRRLNETRLQTKAETTVISLHATIDSAADHAAVVAGRERFIRDTREMFGQDRIPTQEIEDAIRVALACREASLEAMWRQRKAAGR